MTLRQRILKMIYPLLVLLGKTRGSAQVKSNKENRLPIHPVYDLDVELNNSSRYSLSQLKGKKILVVNTASDCGFTGQYAELQQLYNKYQDKLVIIGFPSNDFKEQEKGSDEEIAQFCQVNYGVTFPLARKSSVIQGPAQNPLFSWLSNKEDNGWNDKAPSWNFSKYLLNEEGVLTHYFEPSVSPLSNEVIAAVK
ncbi:MAG TPA: glutathione peroxidase [Flavisolibacter sp.]|nr:glutathione peroxidase [Flavisolibacter sp.]